MSLNIISNETQSRIEELAKLIIANLESTNRLYLDTAKCLYQIQGHIKKELSDKQAKQAVFDYSRSRFRLGSTSTDELLRIGGTSWPAGFNNCKDVALHILRLRDKRHEFFKLYSIDEINQMTGAEAEEKVNALGAVTRKSRKNEPEMAPESPHKPIKNFLSQAEDTEDWDPQELDEVLSEMDEDDSELEYTNDDGLSYDDVVDIGEGKARGRARAMLRNAIYEVQSAYEDAPIDSELRQIVEEISSWRRQKDAEDFEEAV